MLQDVAEEIAPDALPLQPKPRCETFRVGGIDFEMGDFMVNHSDRARKARRQLGLKCSENIQDSIVATRDLLKHAFRIKPDGLFVNCTYRGYERIKDFPRMDYINALPEQTVWEYSFRHTVKKPDFAARYQGAPKHRRYSYLHWFDSSTNTMETDYVPEIARVFPGLADLDFEFAGTYGELSAVNTPLADRNYRAQVAWAKNPNLKLEDFD